MKPIRLMMFSVFLGLLLSSCATAPESTSDSSIVTTLRSFESSNGVTFNTLADALETTGLGRMIDEGEGPYTLFAPNDQAFAALPKVELEALLADDQALTDVLKYHILGSNGFTEGALFKLAPNGLTTMSGANLNLTFSNEKTDDIPGSGAQGVEVNGERLSFPDIVNTRKFVVHGIKAVLTSSK